MLTAGGPGGWSYGTPSSPWSTDVCVTKAAWPQVPAVLYSAEEGTAQNGF